MRLYWHPFSVFPRRIRVALREKRIACDEVEVDLPGGAHRTPEFLRMNPAGKLPILEDDGFVVAESIAILEYLEERHPTPALLPGDLRARARVRQLMAAADAYFTPDVVRHIHRVFAEPRDQWDARAVAEDTARIAAHLDVLERRLEGRDHLAGPFTLADVVYVPFVTALPLLGLASLLAGRPAVAAWIARLNARPSVRDTAPAGT